MAQQPGMRPRTTWRAGRRVIGGRTMRDRIMQAVAIAGPLTVLLSAIPGLAAPVVYYHGGSWHAFTDQDASGGQVCGIGTSNPADGRNLTMTYTIGGSDLTLRAVKPNWNIPDGTMIGANMQLDQNQPWEAQASGHGNAVEWVISAAMIRNFDTEFRNGTRMIVSFPTGNEPPWTVALNGSTTASATLWRCVQDLSDKARVATPASNAPPPTQPFGQAPTQPYGQAPADAAPATGGAPTGGAAPANNATPPASGVAGAPADGSGAARTPLATKP